MQEDYEESISLTLRTRSSKKPSKNARRKLETPMAPAMPCKTCKKSKHGETRSKTLDFKSKFACILEASESIRMRMEESLPKYHDDHIAGKGDNSLQHYNLVHKFIPVPLAMKIPAAKAAADKEWEKLEKIPAWDKTKARDKIWSDRWSKKKAEKYTSPHWWTSVIWRMPNWIQSTKNTEAELYCEVILWKTIQGLTQYSLNKGLQHLKWRQQRSRISYPECQVAQDRHKIIESSKFGMPRHMDSSTTTQMAKIMVQYWRPSCSSWAESVRSSFGRTIMGKAIWENPIETWLGEDSKLGMSLCASWKRIILICVWGWHKIGWKETKYWSDVESTQQRSWFGRTNIFLWSCIPGMYSKTLWNKQRYRLQMQNHVWIQNFRRSNWKTTMLEKSAYIFVFMWYGRSCQEMCGTMLWFGELNNSTTLQSFNSVHRWSPLQRRRIEICWKIVTNMLSNCSEMLVLGTYW